MSTRFGVRRPHGPRPALARPFAKLSAALAALGVVIATAFVGVPAVAADLPLGGGQILNTAFEIDGDMSGANDWIGVAGGGYGPYTTSQGYMSTGILGRTTNSEYCVGTGRIPPDDVFASGQAIDGNPDWVIVSNAANEKSDLCDAGAAWEIVNVNGQQHVILYQYWSRAPSGTGTLTVYLNFAGPNPGRADDFILQFDYLSNGPKVEVSVLRWNGSRWAAGTAVYDADCGSNGPAGNVGTFGESAVDLTASGVLPESGCQTITAGDVFSRTGGSQNANLEDFMKPGPAMEISTCADLKVTKNVTGGVPAGTQFTYRVDQGDTKPVQSSATTGSGPNGTVVDEDPASSAIRAKIGANQTHTWTNVIAQPDYQVSELTAGLPPGVSLDSIVCSYNDYFQAGAPRVSETLVQNGVSTGKRFPIFQRVLDSPAPECVITNRVTSLTLNKVLVNDHGGAATLADFVLTATNPGGTAVINAADPDPSPAVGATALVAPGTYTLSETQRSGYQASSWTCTGATQNGAAVTIAAGQSPVCTITNDDVPAKLTLVKDVKNTWGGTAADTDFTLTAVNGSTTISGAENSPAVTDASVPVGTWTVGEVAKPGYAQTGVACWTSSARTTPVAVTAGKITLAAGGTAYCEVSNADVPGTLTLVKQVTNDNGGTLDASARDADRDRPRDAHRQDRRSSGDRRAGSGRHLHARRGRTQRVHRHLGVYGRSARRRIRVGRPGCERHLHDHQRRRVPAAHAGEAGHQRQRRSERRGRLDADRDRPDGRRHRKDR